jgi:hypothetical protein
MVECENNMSQRHHLPDDETTVDHTHRSQVLIVIGPAQIDDIATMNVEPSEFAFYAWAPVKPNAVIVLSDGYVPPVVGSLHDIDELNIPNLVPYLLRFVTEFSNGLPISLLDFLFLLCSSFWTIHEDLIVRDEIPIPQFPFTAYTSQTAVVEVKVK